MQNTKFSGIPHFNNTADMIEREQQLDKESSSAPTVRKKEHYTCAKCLYKTYRKDLLAKHVSKHMTIHGENSRRRRYYCGLCNKPSMAKGNMRMHILYKHSGSMAPYKCRIGSCKDTFERKFDFNKHIVTHVSYKPFVCQLCCKGFFSERQWDAHLENIHGLSL